MKQSYNGLEIAVIGLAGRFPGAATVSEYWMNLKNGVSSIRNFSEQELIEAGVEPQLVHNPEYVRAKGYMDGAERFDADFFGYTPLEARMMDPQMRIFHECVWEALEDAGYASGKNDKLIGLFAGASPNHVWEALMSLSGENEILGHWAATQLIDKDYLSLRISHKLDLKGPAVTIYTACSTSLVAVHMACQALLNGECDMALAGGVTVTLPDKAGYLFQEGMILSPDGKCKAFDIDGKGIVGGDGAGVVVLKRLREAIDDNDNIYAIIKGSAVNNDGSNKTGFTAPSTKGQAEVIRTALKVSEVPADSIDFIECHGTGTPLGDPIEIEALEIAYNGLRRCSCALGSVKTNVGHLDSAAGIASFIKTVLAVKNGMIPPSLHFVTPNPQINLIEKGFYVNEKLTECRKSDRPVRAGVSAFGIGGTNAHVIVEQVMEERTTSPERDYCILTFSAKSRKSLDNYKDKFAQFMATKPGLRIADVAFTLQIGRKHFCTREIAVCRADELKPGKVFTEGSVFSNTVIYENPPVIFMFGDFENETLDGNQIEQLYKLYCQEPAAAKIIDQGIKLLGSSSKGQNFTFDINNIDCNESKDVILFLARYATAKMLMEWGVRPHAVFGYKSGELLAATVTGAITLEEAIGALSSRKGIGCYCTDSCEIPFIPSDKIGTFTADPGTVCLMIGEGTEINNILDNKKDLPVKVKIDKLNTYSIAHSLGLLWLYGVEINWKEYYRYQRRNRVSLPTYAFEHYDFHLDRQKYNLMNLTSQAANRMQTIRDNDIRNWIYMPAWESSAIPLNLVPNLKKQDSWLIFSDETGVGKQLSDYLNSHNIRYVLVEQGRKYEKAGSDHYFVNPLQQEDMEHLFNDIGHIPQNICYLWTLTSMTETTLENIDNCQQLFFYNILKIVQCLGMRYINEKINLMVVSNGLYSITGDEALYPIKALLLGAVKIIPYEYPNVNTCNVDIGLPHEKELSQLETAKQILREFQFGFPNKQVAYRGQSRWIDTVKKALFLSDPENIPVLKEKLVCLITGGFGGMGFTLAEYLAKNYKARLALVSRSYFPPRREWEEWLDQKPGDRITGYIKRIMKLEKDGAEIEVYNADVSDYAAMQYIVRQAEERFGPINGVLHTAGVIDYAGVIQRRTKEATDPVLLPKVKGTMVLDAVLGRRKLDFFVLFSSIGNYIYGRKFGQVGYNAANEFLDAYALFRLGRSGDYTASINWNDWRKVGMSVRAMEQNRALNKKVNDAQFNEESITPEEGVEVFKYVLGNQLNRAIVSVVELPEIMRSSNNINESLVLQSEAGAIAEEVNSRAPDTFTQSRLEDRLAEIWRSVLGVSSIGIRDDFFELGGDSLKAITIISLVYKKLGVKIHLPAFFQNPTIEAIAGFIRESGKESGLVIKKAEQKEGYIMTPSQKQLYVLSQMEPSGKHYNNIIALKITGPLEYDKLERCLDVLVKRHESLRTSFRTINNEILQVIDDNAVLKPDYINIENSRNDTDSIIEAWIKSFDLSKAPLINVGIFIESSLSHIIVFNIHHIITDGISNGILIKEFAELYKNNCRVDTLPEIAIQYKDYSEWRENEGYQGYESHKRYWLEKFAGEIPLLNLPTDFIRPAYKKYVGDTEFFRFEREETEKIKGFAAAHGVTLYMLLFAVWNILLAKICDQDDIVVGVPVSGRSHSEVQNVVGMFVNTLPIRSFIDSELTFSDFMLSVKHNITSALEHQYFPFEELVRNINVSRDFGRNPVFDVMFAFQNTIGRQYENGLDDIGLRISRYEFKNKYSRFDMVLDGELAGDELVFSLEYSTELFKNDTILRFIRYFKKIMSDVVRNPEIKVKQISLLDHVDEALLLNGFNRTTKDYPRDITVHRLFEEQVRREPDKIALRYKNRTMTFGELNAKADQVARVLRNKGVGSDDVVALITNRSFEMIIGIFAILKSGGAYLPIDPNCPQKRITYMLDDCDTRLVLTNIDVDLGGSYDIINMNNPDIYLTPGENVPDACNSSNLAYCIYTSGTTGVPKGILIEHRSLINFAYGIKDIIPWNPDDRFLSLTTVSFDIFWLESILPLLNGLQVVIASEEEQMDALMLANQIKTGGITVLQTTPSRLKLLLSDDKLAEQLSSLCYLLVGGEAFSQSLLDEARKVVKRGRIFNLYGPTETTIWSTVKEVTGNMELNIGRPIQNTYIYILNKDLQTVPVSIPGILYIGGDGLARGYVNKPWLTSEKFIDNPYRPGEKIYCTGDVAKWTEDGNIVFIGRNDFQVKIRGFRIEAAEIESQIEKYPGINKVVIITKKDAHDDNYLVAYYTADTEITGHELREYLLELLPDYMIPQHFIQIDSFPLNINGKIDRTKLSELAPLADAPKEYIEPRDEIEAKLFGIWKNILGIDRIGVFHQFFELGGNSIQIMRIIYEINKCFNISFSFKDFIRLQTIEAIARYIRKGNYGDESSGLPLIVPDTDNLYQPFPLTNVQMAYYLGRSDRFELGGISTHSYQEIIAEVDIDRLNECLNLLIKRHPMLRSVFLDDARQQILKDVPYYHIFTQDLTAYDEQKRARIINEKREKMSHHIFNPGQWPLFEVVAFRLSEKEYLICISYDLLIMDAYSMEILSKEISALYDNPDAKLDDISITFRDYMIGYQQLKNSRIYLQDKEFWLDKLNDFPMSPNIPLKINPLQVKNPYFMRKSKQYGRKSWERLAEISRKNNLTPSVVLLTAYAQVLAYWSNQYDFSINLTIFNRLPFHPDVNKLVGDFTSLILLDVHLKPDDSFWEKAAKIRDTLMEALAHRHFDGIDFMREISKRNESGFKALMPIVFTSALFENPDESSHSDEDAEHVSDVERNIVGITQTSQVYLDNQVGLINNRMVINWDYIDELFDPAVIDQMFEQYVALIDSIIDNSQEIKMLSISQNDIELINAYNDTREAIPKKTLHGLFEEAARKFPDATAIEAFDEKITYEELERKSSQLSRYLKKNGIQSGDLVGLIAERKIGTFINMLGILKSGAAYVPIDPEYPQERKDFIRDNSKCKLLLNHDFYDGIDFSPYSQESEDEVHNADSLAYVIYTSGSTGRPKGVMIKHHSACNTIIDINRKFNIYCKDRILGISSLCFDLSVYDIFGAFEKGATLVLIKEQKNIPQILDTLTAKKITVWNSVPAIMDRVISEIIRRGGEYVNYSLRLVLLSGDWIAVNLPAKIKQFFAAAEVISLGGATEGSIWSIYYPIDQVSPDWKSIPYGKPLANQKFYVLNEQMQLCPVEVPGELYIGGVGVAEGYLNDPEKTANAFINHPQLGYIYKTGDFGVLHRNGLIEFLGRKDQQVKINGYRVELGEIESQLIACENIKNAVVLASGTVEKRLIAYVVPSFTPEDQQELINNCRRSLAKALPDYMIPHHFIVLDEFPLTANSKVDVNALLKLQPVVKSQVIVCAEPGNEVENKIADIFKEVLNIPNISVLDNFFDIGIDSVQIARLNSRLRMEFNKEIPILSMYEYPNINSLANYLAGDNQASNEKLSEEKASLISRRRDRIKQRSEQRRNKKSNE